MSAGSADDVYEYAAQNVVRVLSYVCDGRMGARPDLPKALEAGLARGVDVIAAQGNGMDAGPYYLGSGSITGAPPNRSDLEPTILGAKRHHIPFVLSLGGRAGADAHLEAYLRVIDQIAMANGVTIRAAVISGEVSKDYLLERLAEGALMPRLFDTPRLPRLLQQEHVREAARIQSQMGPEPIMEALRQFEAGEIDGVLTGRALDLGVLMAYPLLKGVPLAQAAHMAKVMECGGFCCDPPNPFTAVVAEALDDGAITIEPALEDLRCSAKSVSSHALYERDNPNIERNPGGDLDISEAEYEQVSSRLVKAHGATWSPNGEYTVKLEGVRRLGFEASLFAVVRDHALLPQLKSFATAVVEASLEDVGRSGRVNPVDCTVAVHVLGQSNGQVSAAHELSLVVRVAAPSQVEASYLANTIRVRLNQYNYPGRQSTAGNLALPFAQGFVELGECFVFNIWHLMPLTDPTEPFHPRIVEFPRPQVSSNGGFSQ
jgi:Acyclic terpene utilisation family protein AtuA